MSQEFPQTIESQLQISPEELAEFERIKDEMTNTFDLIFALYDQAEEEDKSKLFPFLEQANLPASKFNTLFTEVSDKDFSPQNSVLAMIRQAENLYGELRTVKAGLEAEMKSLDYEVNISVVDEADSASSTEESESVSEALDSAKEAESPLEALTQRYKMADESVFMIDGGETGPRRKPFKEIRSELKTIFEAQKYGEYGSRFLNEIIDAAGIKIGALNAQKKAEKAWKKRDEANKLINGLYQDMLEDIAVFMQTVKVDIEEGVSPEASLPEEGHEDIEQSITSATETFKTLSEQLSPDSPLRESPEFLATAQAVSVLEAYHEEDPVRAAADKQRMNKVLQKTLHKLIPILGQNLTHPANVFDVEATVLETHEAEEGLNPYEVVGSTEEVKVDTQIEVVTPEAPIPEEAVVTEAEVAPVVEGAVPTGVNDSTYVEKYQNKRREWREAKQVFREKETAYQAAMAEYFQADNWKAKMRSGLFNTKKLLGLNPELPEALQAMRTEYQDLRAVYAQSLDAALKGRSEADLENKEYETDSDATKAAFASKFILKPGQKLLSLQERASLSPEKMECLAKVMGVMAKHKWTTRIGVVAAAGVVGGLSGGVGLMAAGAGLQVSKMALSAFAGAGAAQATKSYFQDKLVRTSHNLTSAEAAAKGTFSLSSINTLDEAFVKAQSEQKNAERQLKVAPVAAAVVAGGATGFASGQFGQEDIAEALGGNAAEVSGSIETEVVAPTAEVAATPQVVETISAVEVNPVKIAEIKITLEGVNGKLSYENVLSDISFGANSNAEALGVVEQVDLISFIKLKADDLLSAHPNMSEAKLESELFKSAQGKFGTTSWWSEAKISQVDIGKFELKPVAGIPPGIESASLVAEQNVLGGTEIQFEGDRYTEAAPVTEKVVPGGTQVRFEGDNYTEAAPVSEVVRPTGSAVTFEGVTYNEAPQTYVVGKGDSLSEIVEKKFSADLKGLTPSERNAVFDKLFDKIQNSQELKSSLGLRSGDVDLIYAGQKLNLSVIDSELDKVLGQNGSVGQFTRSAPVAVTPDAGVQNIPITVVENAIPGGTEVVFENAPYTEAAPGTSVSEAAATTVVTPEAPITAPRAFALNGQYAEHPEYREYITKVFGSGKEFEQAVDRAVKSFDNRTYDIFDRSSFLGGGNYESPYRLLGDMSLQEVTEFEAQSNDQIRYFLTQNNIKYDTYLAWLDQIDYMVKTLPNNENTTVADLFTRYVTETHIPNKILSK
jgi:hypothetical protein